MAHELGVALGIPEGLAETLGSCIHSSLTPKVRDAFLRNLQYHVVPNRAIGKALSRLSSVFAQVVPLWLLKIDWYRATCIGKIRLEDSRVTLGLLYTARF